MKTKTDIIFSKVLVRTLVITVCGSAARLALHGELNPFEHHYTIYGMLFVWILAMLALIDKKKR